MSATLKIRRVTRPCRHWHTGWARPSLWRRVIFQYESVVLESRLQFRSTFCASATATESPQRCLRSYSEQLAGQFLRLISDIVSWVGKVVAIIAALASAYVSSVDHTSFLPVVHAPSYASVAASSDHEMRRWAVYKMQKFFSKSIISKILAVFAVAAPIVVVTGYLYTRTSGQPLSTAMFKTYTVLQDTPGATACDETDVGSSFVLNLTHVVGLFTYALVLGIVSEDVTSLAEGFKKGNTDIVESGHTVVLNMNSTSEHILRQWARAQMERGQDTPIVLLADIPKEDLNDLVDRIRRETGLDIMAREGIPFDVDDLQLVSASKAKTVLVMDPDHGSEEEYSTHKVMPFTAALVSLAATGSPESRVVLQLPSSRTRFDEHQWDTLQSAINLHTDNSGKSRVIAIDPLESLRDAKTQCAVAPGVAEFFSEVFHHTQDSVEVYCTQFPEVEGMTFREARHRFPIATLMGFSRNDKVFANPPDSAVLHGEDWLFGIANNQDDFKLSQGRVPDPVPWDCPEDTPDVRARRVILAAYTHPTDATLHSLANSMPEGSSLSVVCPEKIQVPPGQFELNFIHGHPGSITNLKKAGIESADSLLLAGMHDWKDTEADIQILCAVAQVSDVVATMDRARPLHVVAEARGPLLGEFAHRLQRLQARKAPNRQWRLITTDILSTEELCAGFLAQCGMQPHLSNILKEIFDVEDAAISICHPLKYMKAGETVPLLELQDRSRLKNELVLGWVDSNTAGTVPVNKSTIVSQENIQSLIIMTGSVEDSASVDTAASAQSAS